MGDAAGRTICMQAQQNKAKSHPLVRCSIDPSPDGGTGVLRPPVERDYIDRLLERF